MKKILLALASLALTAHVLSADQRNLKSVPSVGSAEHAIASALSAVHGKFTEYGLGKIRTRNLEGKKIYHEDYVLNFHLVCALYSAELTKTMSRRGGATPERIEEFLRNESGGGKAIVVCVDFDGGFSSEYAMSLGKFAEKGGKTYVAVEIGGIHDWNFGQGSSAERSGRFVAYEDVPATEKRGAYKKRFVYVPIESVQFAALIEKRGDLSDDVLVEIGELKK